MNSRSEERPDGRRIGGAGCDRPDVAESPEDGASGDSRARLRGERVRISAILGGFSPRAKPRRGLPYLCPGLAWLALLSRRRCCLDGHAQGVEQSGYSAIESGGESQFDAGLRVEVLSQRGVSLIRYAPIDEGIGEG